MKERRAQCLERIDANTPAYHQFGDNRHRKQPTSSEYENDLELVERVRRGMELVD